MNILITGATGFVGSQLCKRMSMSVETVRGAVWDKEQNCSLPDNIVPVQINAIGPDTDWTKALEGVDVVIHLAARVHLMKDEARDPLQEYRKVNVQGTEHLAIKAAEHGVKRLVFLSSVKVNGEESSQPYTEDDVPAPEDPYGISKMEAEEVLRKVTEETGLETVILRSPLVYGPGVKANFLKMVESVYNRTPLPLGSIRNSRSYIGLSNLCEVIEKCVISPDAAGETFIVSDNQDMSTPEIIQLISKALAQKDANMFPFPVWLLKAGASLLGRKGTIDRLAGTLTVDTSKIQKMLGWTPTSSVEDELGRIAEWYLGRN